ncbi:acylneuraminate cytidylyltransferase family protein [Halobacteriales archaeon QH_3_68_24]|nr:MAG: acylneuraminate cytidylyltransferase family protein [Halobacteriales archaeon QH_3_68_24]
MSVLGLVPCRGGSKGIPRKNVREVAGEPLLAHTVRASCDAERVDRTVVSTDDAEIKEAALEAGADVPFDRPAELATDEALIEPVIEHAVEWLREHEGETYDTIALLQATAPLRTAEHVDEAVATYEAEDADSLVAVSEGDSYRWRETPDGAEIVNYDSRKRRQEKEPEYVESGALYLVDTDLFLETGDLQAGKTALSVLDRVSALDIDEPFELWMADEILSEWRT